MTGVEGRYRRVRKLRNAIFGKYPARSAPMAPPRRCCCPRAMPTAGSGSLTPVHSVLLYSQLGRAASGCKGVEQVPRGAQALQRRLHVRAARQQHRSRAHVALAARRAGESPQPRAPQPALALTPRFRPALRRSVSENAVEEVRADRSRIPARPRPARHSPGPPARAMTRHCRPAARDARAGAVRRGQARAPPCRGL